MDAGRLRQILWSIIRLTPPYTHKIDTYIFISQNCEKTVDSTVSKILLSFAVSPFKSCKFELLFSFPLKIQNQALTTAHLFIMNVQNLTLKNHLYVNNSD